MISYRFQFVKRILKFSPFSAFPLPISHLTLHKRLRAAENDKSKKIFHSDTAKNLLQFDTRCNIMCLDKHALYGRAIA